MAGIAYELSDSKKKYTRKVLKLPDKDTILYCDTVSGDGDFAECALTNTGLYFKTGIVGKITPPVLDGICPSPMDGLCSWLF